MEDTPNENSEQVAVRCIRWMGESDRYRVWYDNWDAQVEPVSIAEAVDDVESELGMCSQAMLVTRGDLSQEETLRVVDNLRQLIVTSIANHGDSPIHVI